MALDTLYFDLKLNDLTESQMEAIKSRLEKELGQGLDIGKNIKKSIDNANMKVKVGADTTVVEASIRRIKEIMNQPSMTASDRNEMLALSKVIKNVSDDKTKLARVDEIAMRSADAHALAQERLAKAALQTEKAQQSLATAHTRATQSANSHINANVRLGQSLTGLISITGDLRNQIGMLVSAYTVEHLLKNVVEIGGEFEKQKLAMGSMLGSLEQADDIFNRMKNLALTSPFNFKDLSNYSRQLTAFGTPYKDLYDTTNRLADISAGLGGDMSRLVLAFSQVKAAAYLRGQEMRQFTEFGVSLPDLLAKKYSEAEHRIVTAGDVIERVSKRMVSFNDVKDVLWKSTDKGGQFYGMQGVLSQSTSGMASNLKDAIDTMYYDIANSNSGMIKESIKGITELVSHWRELTSVLAAGTFVYTANRLVMAAHNRMIGMNTAETLKGVMASKQEEASLLRHKELYGELSIAEKERLATVNTLTATDLKLLATSKAISADQLMRMVNTKSITATQAFQVASTLELSESEKRYLVTLRALDIQIEKSKLGILSFANAKKQALMFGNKVATIGTDLWSSIKGFFTLPNLLMTGAFIGLDLWMNYQQELERVKQVNDTTLKDARDSYKNLSDFIKSNPIDITIKSGDESDIQKLLETYRNQLESSPLEMTSVLAEIDDQTINNKIEKLKRYYQAVNELKQASEIVKNTGANPFTIANSKSDGGWFKGIFKDELDTNIKDVGNAIMDMRKAFTDFDIDKVLNFKSANNGLKSVIEKLKQMKSEGADNYELTKSFYSLINSSNVSLSSLGDIKLIGNKEHSDYTNTLKTESEQAKAAIKSVAESMGYDINNMTQSQKLAVAEFARQWVQSLSNASQESKDIFTSQIEDMLFKTDKNMENHTKSWDILGDKISDILRSKGKDIASASKKDMEMATVAAMNQLRTLHPEMSNFINWMSSNLPTVILHVQTQYNGGPKDLSYQNFVRGNLKGNYGSGISKRQNQYLPNAGETAEQFHERMSSAYSDAKKSKEIASETMSKAKQGSSYYHKAAADFTRADTAMSDAMDALQAAGFNDILEKGTPKAKGSKTDQFLKDIQTQAEMIKKAVDVYKQGVQSGESQLASIGDIEKLGIFPKGTFEKITSEEELNNWYKDRLNYLISSLRKAKTSNERKKELSTLLADSLSFDRDEFKREWDSKKQAIEEELTTITEQWSNYKSMYNITGNKSFSAMAAFGNGTLSFDNMGEVLKNMIQKTVGNKNTFDQLLGMTEQQIKAKYSGTSQILIELVSKYKEYTKSERSEEEKLYEDSVKSTMGYYAKIEQISSEYDKKISIARKNNNPILANKLESEKQTKIDALNPQYLLFYQSALNFTKDKAREIGQALKDGLVKQMQDGTISAHDYAETIEKINNLLEESEKRLTPLQSFMDSGANGYFKNIYDAGKQKIDTGASMQKQGQEIYDKFNQIFKSSQVGSSEKSNAFMQMMNGKGMIQSGQNMKDMGQSMQQMSSKGANAIAVIDRIIKAIDQTFQATNQATQAIAEMQESFGVNTNKGSWLDFKSFTNGMSEFSSKAKAGWESLKSGDVAGAISNNISAYASIFTNFNKLHDKKLQNKIDDLDQQITEENLTIKKVEDALKYHLGNAAEGFVLETSEVKKVRSAMDTVNSLKGKSNLTKFDLSNLQSANQILKDSKSTVEYLKTGNAYNYQRDLYKDQLEQLKQQKAYEEDKKKSDQSKINEYDSQIEEMETKIQQFSLDLANSLYGIDIKVWASQLGDALFEAWQKGEDGAEAFRNKANEIIASVANKWLTQNIIEPAMKKMMTDMVGEDGQGGWLGENNNMTQSDIINNLSKDLYDVESSVDTYNKAVEALDEAYKKTYGKSLKDAANGSSSTANSISGVTEQEANIIAAYMDAIRQDTYNNRMNLLKIVENGVKIEDSPMMQAQLQQLVSISSNTYKNADYAEKIYEMFRGNMNGNGTKIYMA